MITRKYLIRAIIFNFMIENLKFFFGNNTRALEILYLLEGIKRAVRLDANEIELGKIKEFCQKENLHFEVSDFKVVKITDDGKGKYSNIVKRIPLNYFDRGLYHVYISKDKAIAKFLKFLENKNDDGAVGKLLGYPKCCVDFFLKNKEEQKHIQNDYILPALKNSEGFKFPFYANYAARYFDVALMSHFPHSFDCKDSIGIAKKNLECIKKYSKELANKFEEMLKGAVLYTERDGVFIFKDYKFSDNTIRFNKILSTTNNELFNLLNKSKEFTIISKNKVKIGNNIIDDAGFMVFV